MANRVFLVEKFVYGVKHGGHEPSEEEVRLIGGILGQPTKKLSVVLDRYRQIFDRYIEKRCVDIDEKSVCIYSWSQRVPFKVFQLSMHATGTIILFEGGMPKEVLAYPIPKALSYAKVAEALEGEYGSITPREVTKRVDGWQLTAYYNTVLGRWVFATRYVLHNMYFERGKLVVEPFNSIANPFVYVADRLAYEKGLYEALNNFKGWTFTFVLKGPEPAITRPPYPLEEEYSKYELYLLMARDPSGKLYTWSETANMLRFEHPERVEPKRLSELYREIAKRLDTRSYVAYVDTGDPENPLLIELESEVYQDAMYAKYLYDAKAAMLLVTEGLTDRLIEIVDSRALGSIAHIVNAVKRFRDALSQIDAMHALKAGWEIARTLIEFRKDVDVHVEELSKALAEKNVGRVVRKALSMLLEGRSLMSKDTIEVLEEFTERLEQRLRELKT